MNRKHKSIISKEIKLKGTESQFLPIEILYNKNIHKTMKHKKHKKHNIYNTNNIINKSRYINKTKKNKSINNHNHKHNHKHSRLHLHSQSQSHKSNNYISKLINVYYDNENVKKNFLKYKNTKQHIFPEQNRVIVIGDIHGDFDVAIKCLIIAKCIKEIQVPHNKNVEYMNNFFNELEWIGNDTYIVQLGDQIDRVRPQKWDNNDVTIDNAFKDEGSTLEIFYLFYYLDKIARKHNGRVFSIIGNHEIMNVEGDFRYVSLKEFKSFKDHLENVYHKKSKFPYHSRTLKNHTHILNKSSNSDYSKLPNGYKERLYAFSPTGLCSNLMGTNSYILLQIGNWLFCHGSPVIKTLKAYSTEMINNFVSLYLIGIENLNDDSGSGSDKYNNITKNYIDITKSSDDSVLWNRDFGETQINENLEDTLLIQLDTILEAYNTKNNKNQHIINAPTATHIAVGHTIQDTEKNGINSICNKRVWRCDVAMSKAFGNNKMNKYRQPQVLEILNGNITNVLY